MKKIVSLVITFALCFTALTGCGAKSVDLSEVMNKINSDFSLSLQKLEDVDKLNQYYSIEADDVKQFAAEIDSNNDAPVEIVLVEAVDSDAAGRVESALTTRYNAIINQYSSYTPDKLSMVQACKVTKDGNYVTMIVADEGPKMLEVFYDYLK